MATERKVYLMMNEWGQVVCGFSNMLKAYQHLTENGWQEPVNYSYFSRVIKQEDNSRWWEYAPGEYRGRSIKVRFAPVKIF